MKLSKFGLLPVLAAAVLLTGCRKTTVDEFLKNGVAAADNRDWKTALIFAEKGVARDPENVDALLLKALSARRCQQPEVAYDAASRAAKLAPNNFFAQYTLGCVCLEAAGHKSEAKAAFLEALKLRSDDRDTLIALCNLAAENGDPKLLEYLKQLERCALKDITDSAAFHNQKGVALLLVRDHDNALREFNKAQRKFWDDPNIIYNAACAYDRFRLASGRVKKQAVRELYERYLELTAKDRSAARIRAQVQARVRELGGR